MLNANLYLYIQIIIIIIIKKENCDQQEYV